jgi:hypothetical protein
MTQKSPISDGNEPFQYTKCKVSSVLRATRACRYSFRRQRALFSDAKEPYFWHKRALFQSLGECLKGNTCLQDLYSCQYYVSLKKSALQSCHILNLVAGRTSQNRISRGSLINRVDDYEQNNALQFCCISNLVAGGPWRNSICWHVLYSSTQQEQGFCAWM